MILEFLKVLFPFLRKKKTERVCITAEVTDTPYEDAWEGAEPWKTFPCSSVEEAARLNNQLTMTTGNSLVSRYDADTGQLDVRIFNKELLK